MLIEIPTPGAVTQAAPDPLDDRVTCPTCRNLWQSATGLFCLVPKAAGLTTREPMDF